VATVTFRLHQQLWPLLARERRRESFDYGCAQSASAKHALEALGVPHTEVEWLAVNGLPAGLDRPLRQGDLVEAWPRLVLPPPGHCQRLRTWPDAAASRFIADAHLGGLARLLRLAGFNTLYRQDYQDQEIARISAIEGRIALTRDRELLKQRDIEYGCFVREQQPWLQLTELLRRLQLATAVQPFSLCLECNVTLQQIERTAVLDRLPPAVRLGQRHFTECAQCGRLYWQGSHWKRMREKLDAALATSLERSA
jgi:uncharacterized protein